MATPTAYKHFPLRIQQDIPRLYKANADLLTSITRPLFIISTNNFHQHYCKNTSDDVSHDYVM